MEGSSRPSLVAAALILMTTVIVVLGVYGLLKPISNGCIMTYMYPTYVPVLASSNGVRSKYGLFLYHEGWKSIDYEDHLSRINGVPVLFIPGNGGSYKQVRSLGAESERAFQRGVLERTFYQEGTLECEGSYNMAGFHLSNRYSRRLDWFSVDLEGEHSAMDGQILEDHTDYVVYAIHRILDLYEVSRGREGASVLSKLPKSVILVGHSMGGFVARAAVVHPRLRKGAVETIVTLSSPHQFPPVALQPSLSHYFFHVNEEWRKGYKVQTSPSGNYQFDPPLSNVVVVSLSGGFNDYQVRTSLLSLNGIVPPSHGFMVSSTSITNVWLSMEHQVILWCNQLVVRVSHSLLSLVDPKKGQPISDAGKRLAVLAKMLGSGIPQSFPWIHQSCPFRMTADNSPTADSLETSLVSPSSCPSNIPWNNNELEKDLYIQSTIIAVLAMDGRRRWLDIHKLGSNGKSHFILVTNLSPCYGIRIHLWPEKNESKEGFAASNVVEVTTKLIQIPSRPTPRQSEPGSQTEQVSPSSVLWLTPENLRGFRFLTVSVVHQQTVSGRPPAASMAVGQFFDPDEGSINLSAQSFIMSSYFHKKILLPEEHPLALNLSFPFTPGLFPISLSLKTAGCGLEKEDPQLCKILCFPPLALAWDSTSGLHVFTNLSSGTIVVDSPPIKPSFQGSQKTTVLLLVDPHCFYEIRVSVLYTLSASRFFLLHGFQILGLAVVVIFFALMNQARAWDANGSTPSLLQAVESNLRITFPSLLLALGPIGISFFAALFKSHTIPSFGLFAVIYLACYALANGFVLLLSLFSQSAFHAAARAHVSLKSRWQNTQTRFLHHFATKFSSLKVIRIFTVHPTLITSLTAITLGCFVHTAIGLSILLFYHVLSCHYLMCSYVREKRTDSPKLGKSFGESQLDVFYHRHGLLILHFMATLMFLPSLVAALQRIKSGNGVPPLVDSVICIGVILHGALGSKPEFNCLFKKKVGIEFVYVGAGLYCYFCALDFKVYKVLYPMAVAGFLLLGSRIARFATLDDGESRFERRQHSHRH